jgi:hypothetical protein
MAEDGKLDMSLNEIIEREKKGKAEGGSRRVYVGNLAYETQWTSLKDHMRQAGEVVFADILRDYDGRSKVLFKIRKPLLKRLGLRVCTKPETGALTFQNCGVRERRWSCKGYQYTK